MAHYASPVGVQFQEDEEDFDDEEDEETIDAGDRIRRSHFEQRGQQQASDIWHQRSSLGQETIQVTLNEGYFSKERRELVNLAANLFSKLNSMQLFNPAQNQAQKEKQERWEDKEKYTLDSLNEIKGAIDEKFQWTRPEDGREVWPSKLQYFLAITSYSIGLGNVIRFPILVQKNGGLAFIIPFMIMLIVEGIPLFYLELAIGQRMRKAAISCWNLVSPFAAGVGLASAAVSFVIGLYYNTMVAWTLLYLWGSATKRPLPFARCPAELAPERPAPTASNTSDPSSECQAVGSFKHYWFRQTLQASEDVNLLGQFNWPIFVCLAAAWLLSYLCLVRGLSASKRIVYVASTFPYVILTLFFIKAVSLDGMSDGLYYLFAPEWAKLADPYVWLQSAAQVFFSLGLGFGGLIALSSYNPVNNNCYRDSIKVTLINFFTSIYAGVVIFAILGYKAHIDNQRCLEQRDQAINFYLSDYNLKALDHGSAFTPADEASSSRPPKAPSLEQAAANWSQANAYNDYYYDSSDAIDSIRSLDRQIDEGLAPNSLDYGDSDTEFIIDASKIIGQSELDKIIAQIPDLPQCSVQRALDEATQGTGLVFVVMAQAISQFENAPLWAVMFFLMMLTLGLDSQLGNLEGLLSALLDLKLFNLISRKMLTGSICGLSFVISVVLFSHGAGSYIFVIFEEYAGSFALILIAIFELIVISYLYGLKRFCDDCELMTGKRPSFIIMLSWRFISPILLLIIIFATAREFDHSKTYEAWYNGQLVARVWPTWCITLGAFLILACVIWIPIVAILKILRINLISEESLTRCWFPTEELREYHDIQEEHKVTKIERVLFGFTEDD